MEPAPGKYHYWIIGVKTAKVYGPLTLEQFTLQRRTLGVPEMLALKDVETFRP